MTKKIVTLKNGAKAKVLKNGQYRFIKGASKSYLAKIRTKKNKGKKTKTKKGGACPPNSMGSYYYCEECSYNNYGAPCCNNPDHKCIEICY
jgi:hypothetical protein